MKKSIYLIIVLLCLPALASPTTYTVELPYSRADVEVTVPCSFDPYDTSLSFESKVATILVWGVATREAVVRDIQFYVRGRGATVSPLWEPIGSVGDYTVFWSGGECYG